MRGGEAVRARGGEARRAAVVDGAGAAADILGALAAVRHDRVLRRARGERVDGLADEGDLGIGGGEPVVELLVADEVARFLSV